MEMSRTALILIDFEATNVAANERPLKALKATTTPEFVLASRRHNAKTKQDPKGAKLASYVNKLADAVVSKESIGPSAFEGGTLRPIQSTERILKSVPGVEKVIIGGYFLEWAVSQTAFDANALGYQTSIDLSITASENLGDEHRILSQLERLERAGITIFGTMGYNT